VREIISDTRRLAARPASVSFGAAGWNSAYPTAANRFGSTPSRLSILTTEASRAEDSSQFEGYNALAIGRSSVNPSTRIGSSLSRTASASCAMIGSAFSLSSASPLAKSRLD